MQEYLDFQLLEYGQLSVSVGQLLAVVVATALILGVGYLILYRLLPWYYGRESHLTTTRQRARRTVRFVIFSFLAVVILRILDIDFTLIDYSLQPSQSDDGPPVSFFVRISTLIEILAAFIVANVLDLIIEEFLVQRYKQEAEGSAFTAVDRRGARLRFRSVKPLVNTAALLFVANVTGLARLYYNIPHGKESTVVTLGNVLTALILFFFIRLLLNLTTTFFLRRYYERSKVDTGSQFAINRLLTYFVYVIGVLLVIQAAGFNLVAIWTGAAALLVGIGIGLQQTFNDLICGVIILFERSVKVGDVVELTGHQVGTIRKVGTRTSILETRDDIMIFVPNSKLIGENVTNWSQIERKARFHVQVGVAYGSDTALVKEILLAVAADHPRTLNSPPAIVRLLNFGDSSLDFDVIFWSRDFLRIEDIKSDIRFEIDKRFRAQGVEIPFPQRDLHIKQLPVARAQVQGNGTEENNGEAAAPPPAASAASTPDKAPPTTPAPDQ